MKVLETRKALPRVDVPCEVIARAALAACHAQSRVARETLGRAGPLCRVPCDGCLAAARAVAEVVIEASLQPVELISTVAVSSNGA